MSAVQGRKPGWLLDKILGREGAPSPQARPAEPATDTDVLEALSPLSPASASEGQPDFTPAALAPLSAAEPTVTDASSDRLPDDCQVDELAGASLQPVERNVGAPQATPITHLPHAEVRVPDAQHPAEPRSTRQAPASVEASLREAPQDEHRGGIQAVPAEAAAEQRTNWWRRLAGGMRRTSSSIGDGVTGLFTKRRLDRAVLDELEDVLIASDLGLDVSLRIVERVAEGRYNREIEPDEVKAILASEVEKALAPIAQPLVIDRARRPFVLLTVGVNGAGKTTTIGKLAQKFRAAGHRVTIAAGDTFRAAAIEQLKVWGERTGSPVVARAQGSDAAGLAFDALQEARANGSDILMIDTAGRLQNKAGLMDELTKIIRVLKKIDPEAPHATLLVLDATVGQNALSQVELFGKTAGVTGLVMTKLDGTARGGILVALAAKFGLPVHYIGVGEGVDDLEPFTARQFARAIAGLSEAA